MPACQHTPRPFWSALSLWPAVICRFGCTAGPIWSVSHTQPHWLDLGEWESSAGNCWWGSPPEDSCPVELSQYLCSPSCHAHQDEWSTGQHIAFCWWEGMENKPNTKHIVLNTQNIIHTCAKHCQYKQKSINKMSTFTLCQKPILYFEYVVIMTWCTHIVFHLSQKQTSITFAKTGYLKIIYTFSFAAQCKQGETARCF